MKKLFGHLLPFTEVEIDEICKNGTLTVDANVLLDLYRCHSETRDAILRAIRWFEGRLWLSHQAASEFMRNYARVALQVNTELDSADKKLSEMEKAVKEANEKLAGLRSLSREVGQQLKDAVDTAIDNAKQRVDKERAGYSKEVADEILKNVLSLFDGCVGGEPSDAEGLVLKKEAERRIKDKVPPGYEDEKKKSPRAQGDYFLWHQVLQRAKEIAGPIILVTSEQKEDWWERAQGKIIGPRYELLEEAHRVAGQRVFICRTEPFLDHVAKRAGGAVSEIVRSDLRARAELGDDPYLPHFVTTAVEARADEFMHDDAISSRCEHQRCWVALLPC